MSAAPRAAKSFLPAFGLFMVFGTVYTAYAMRSSLNAIGGVRSKNEALKVRNDNLISAHGAATGLQE